MACSVNESEQGAGGGTDQYHSTLPSTLTLESYSHQLRTFWPREGSHILAQYDDNSVVVYQAYKKAIATYAVENQRFGGPAFSFDRMSWVKPNFLWMMYRCGWASKKDQERVLAVRITRQGFDTILRNALTAQFQKEAGIHADQVCVRLQWDPDHDPRGEKCRRRAIQLGLKGEILKSYCTDWIVKIEDITEFVRKQHKVLKNQGESELLTPQERVYHVMDHVVSARIALDVYQDK